MGFIDAYKKVVFENYANFNGRARRAEYWGFTLVTSIISILLYVISIAGIAGGDGGGMLGMIGFGLYGLYTLLVLIPSLAVSVRRLHDVNKSGWFLLLAIIPLVGFYILYLLVIEGTRGPNKYGPDPKNPNADIMENLV